MTETKPDRTRWKRWIETDVLTEAKARIAHIIETHDDFMVSFSGGKDSLVVLHLTREVMIEAGRGDERIKVRFYDEELLPDTVVEFVEEYAALPWVDMHWLAIPLESSKYILGSTRSYIQWDPKREHVRPKPSFAITEADIGRPVGRAITQYDLDAGLIIDGFHRWRLAQDSKRVQEAHGPLVPVVTMDLTTADAMLQTIRINRAKGTHIAIHMSAIVRSLIAEHGYEPKQIAEQIGASLEEVAVLAQDGVFEVRKISEWAYSPAWYPEKLTPGQKHQEKPERPALAGPIPPSPHPAGTGIA